MFRPNSWSSPEGGSPSRVVAGEPGRGPRFLIESWRVDRSVAGLLEASHKLHAGRANRWTCTRFHDQGLYEFMGTVLHPKTA